MSLYRDDVQETMYGSDSFWSTLKSVVEESARIAVVIGYLIAPPAIADSVTIQDSVVDRTLQPVDESVWVQDHVEDRLNARQNIVELAKAIDRLQDSRQTLEHIDDALLINVQYREKMRLLTHEQLKVVEGFEGAQTFKNHIQDQLKTRDSVYHRAIGRTLIEDHVTASDDVRDLTHQHIIDQLRIADRASGVKLAKGHNQDQLKLQDSVNDAVKRYSSIEDHVQVVDQLQHRTRVSTLDVLKSIDEITGIKYSQQHVDDRVQIHDTVQRKATELLHDALQALGEYKDKARLKQYIDDEVRIAESVVVLGKGRHVVEDTGKLQDEWQDRLHAKQDFTDWMFIEDTINDGQHGGHAWTANVDNWAMSRYQDFYFDDLAVVNGQLIGLNDQGVFAIDAEDTVQGEIQSGKIDLGRGALVHPLGAYLEYELRGEDKSLDVVVGTTQSGALQKYRYRLNQERADDLTNGRVIFGRGLRGRHFSFAVKVTGSHCYLNDLSIDLTQTKRRV